MTKKVSRFLIEFPLCMFLLETLCFAVGWHITLWPFVVAFVGLMTYEILHIQRTFDKIIFSISTITIVVLSCLLMAVCYDTSFDGPWYHASTIKNMIDGWNPIYIPIQTINDTPYHIDSNIWMSHYAKGMETVQAGIVAFTGNLESGKAWNLLLFVVLFGYVFIFLKEILREEKMFLRVFLTILIVLNPIVWGQLFTYMIDFTGYTFVLIGAICLYKNLVKKDKRELFTLLLMAFFLPTVKFNTVFWWVVLLVGVLVIIWWIYKISPKQLILSVGLSVALGFLVGGFNPYITNIIHKGNPVYPLIGEDKIEIMDIVTPKALLHKNRLYQVAYSLASNPYHNDKKGEKGFHSLTISRYNVVSSPLHDVQLGGFGMFFFEAMALLLILFAFVKKKDQRWRLVLIILASLFISLLILPSGFFARYVPFFYIFPFVIIIYILKTQKSKFIRGGTHVAIGLLSLSALINIVGVIMLVTVLHTQIDYVVGEVVAKSKECPVYVQTSSCLNYDKMERAGAELVYDKMANKLKTDLDMYGVDIRTSLSPSDFRKETKPLFIRKVSIFDLKISNTEDKNENKIVW